MWVRLEPCITLSPANVEILLLSDDHVIITAILVIFFWVRAYHCSVLFSPVARFVAKKNGLKRGNFKE